MIIIRGEAWPPRVKMNAPTAVDGAIVPLWERRPTRPLGLITVPEGRIAAAEMIRCAA